MTYCRVSIEHTTRGCVYRKDFDPQHVFGPLVLTLASELVRQGAIPEGEPYTSVIIPRYDNSRLPNPVVQVDPVEAQEPRPSRFKIEVQNEPTPGPISFFTLELHFQESGLTYRQELQIADLNYFWSNIQTALLQMHVLQHGDVYVPRIVLRDDDEADFAHEEIQVADGEGDSLIELVGIDTMDPALPYKAPTDFAAVDVQNVVLVSPVELAQLDTEHQDDVQIFIARPTLEALQAIAQQDVSVEQGGVLVGQVYAHGDDNVRYLVEIVGHIVAEDADANRAEFRYNFNSWLRQSEQLKAQYPGKQIVGWYHTHLITVAVQPDASAPDLQPTELFFSDHDRFMHRRFFGDPWYVAMVLGPQGNAAFFRWFGDKISSNRRFYVFSPDDSGQ